MAWVIAFIAANVSVPVGMIWLAGNRNPDVESVIIKLNQSINYPKVN